MTEVVSVSVIIPVLDEEHDIGGCIAAIAAQTIPLDAVELLLVDGGSTDRTAVVAVAAARSAGLKLRVLTNPLRLQSAGLNVGLAAATGMIIVRVDARSRIATNHIPRCVEVLCTRPDVGAVGGAQIARARSARLVDRAIARALNNRYATGFARYRRRSGSGATDTVWMGAFRACDLRSLGGWDASVAKNEDFELNERLRRAGHLVWYDTSISSHYLPRDSVRAIARQYFNYGSVKGGMWATNWRPNKRQIALLMMPIVTSSVFVSCGRLVGWIPTVAGGVAAALALDAFGNKGESATPIVRGSAAWINGVIAGSWWLGVVRGYSRTQRPRYRDATSAARAAATTPRSVPADAEPAQSLR
jgi:glycosyltransferase involved in cell wall biosynthesis